MDEEKKRILIIDDSKSMTAMLKKYLDKTGKFETETVNRGKFGRPSARKFRPDLILLDVMMPDMSGGDVAAEMANDPKLKDVPIVFLTAAVSKEEAKERSEDAASHRYYAKPVIPRALVTYIEEVLKLG